jgi:flagellar biosynthetic protein FliR
LIGGFMGLALQIVTAAVVVAGQTISNSMGLSMASLIDPNLCNVPVIAQFLLILSTLIFVSLGGHAMLLALILESFATLPVGSSLFGPQAYAQLVSWSSMIFLGALLTDLPVMVTLLFISIGLGVVTRAAPSLNIFSVGLPATIVVGFVVLLLWLVVRVVARVKHFEFIGSPPAGRTYPGRSRGEPWTTGFEKKWYQVHDNCVV